MSQQIANFCMKCGTLISGKNSSPICKNCKTKMEIKPLPPNQKLAAVQSVAQKENKTYGKYMQEQYVIKSKIVFPDWVKKTVRNVSKGVI